MAGRYVRTSNFRHVHGDVSKENFSGPALRSTGKQISANEKYFAVACSGGGGPVVVHDLTKTGRFDKFFQLQVHSNAVQQAKFSPFVTNLIATASQDAYIKLCQIPDDIANADNITKASRELQGHYKKVDHLNWNPTASNVIVSASPDNTVKFWDIEAQAEYESFNKEIDTPTCANWNSIGSLVVVGSKGDGSMRIFDPRSSDEAAKYEGFAKKAMGTQYLFADNHDCLIGVGRSSRNARRWKIWDLKKLDKALEAKDIDSSSGVLEPNYDPDNSILYLTGHGDSNISYWELSKGKMFFLTAFSDTKPHKTVAFTPKRGVNVKKCEIAKCLRLCANKSGGDVVIPVSFQVPRKSDLFQKDLYPDTNAGIPTVTADEWKEGKNGEIKMQSMKPGSDVAERTATLVVKKTAAEYEAEVAALKAEIARLKAKVGE